MKHDLSTRTGIGVTLLLAGATFAVAIVSGIFLVYDSAPSLRAALPLDIPAQQTITGQDRVPPHTDHSRANPLHVARLQHPRRAKPA